MSDCSICLNDIVVIFVVVVVVVVVVIVIFYYYFCCCCCCCCGKLNVLSIVGAMPDGAEILLTAFLDHFSPQD